MYALKIKLLKLVFVFFLSIAFSVHVFKVSLGFDSLLCHPPIIIFSTVLF